MKFRFTSEDFVRKVLEGVLIGADEANGIANIANALLEAEEKKCERKEIKVTNTKLDKLKELAERATSKWFRAGRPDMQSFDVETGRPFKNLYNDDIAGTSEAARVHGENSINDTQYIAAVSPDVLLKLIGVVKRLNGVVLERESVLKLQAEWVNEMFLHFGTQSVPQLKEQFEALRAQLEKAREILLAVSKGDTAQVLKARACLKELEIKTK